jgi:hypothetical protein
MEPARVAAVMRGIANLSIHPLGRADQRILSSAEVLQPLTLECADLDFCAIHSGPSACSYGRRDCNLNGVTPDKQGDTSD